MNASLYRYRLPLSQPLRFHDRQISVREGLLLKWENSWGEIAPLPGFSKETLEEAEAEALLCLKGALNADCDGQAGLQELSGNATMLFYMTEEGQEGRNAFNEKRRPDFSKFKRNP